MKLHCHWIKLSKCVCVGFIFNVFVPIQWIRRHTYENSSWNEWPHLSASVHKSYLFYPNDIESVFGKFLFIIDWAHIAHIILCIFYRQPNNSQFTIHFQYLNLDGIFFLLDQRHRHGKLYAYISHIPHPSTTRTYGVFISLRENIFQSFFMIYVSLHSLFNLQPSVSHVFVSFFT